MNVIIPLWLLKVSTFFFLQNIKGGPGSGKSSHAEQVAAKHPGWVSINLGQLLLAEIKNRSTDEKWKAVKDLVVNGELAPEVSCFFLIENI